MDTELKVTANTQVAKRSQVVALEDWRTTDGAAVCILCVEVDAENASRELGVLPGERPKLGIQDGDDAPAAAAATERLFKAAVGMIEMGAWLATADGSGLAPAFHFGPADSRPAGCLEGAKLSERDFFSLFSTICKCSGYVGGAAEATFLRRQRGGAAAVGGALEVLPGAVSNAERGAA
ncbi:MAG TPA: hypothetical protein VNF91_09655 [Candidatus Acidoferrum sp.]|nr:hypothetical protein [Candidatus Acidoferrum sp.]